MTQAIYQGFILSRQQYQAKYGHGITLCYWLSSENGPIKVLIENESAVFFIPQSAQLLAQKLCQQANITVEFKPLALRHFGGEVCTGCYFKNNHSFYQAKQLFDNKVTVFEGDIRHSDRFLMERFIKGGVWVSGKVEHKTGYTLITQAKLKANSDYTPSLSSVSLDIECDAQGVLFSIALVGHGLDVVMMIGEPQTVHNALNIDWCYDEINLLQKLSYYLCQSDPDVIVGWNVIEFDFNVINARAQALGLTLNFGRDKQPLNIRTGHFTRLILPGRCVIDGIDMLKNATYRFESYSLANVAQEILGESKLIQSDNRLNEIIRQFNQDKLALAEYNRQDCILVNRIFAKLNLFEFAVVRTQLTALELEKMGGSVAAFTNLYLPLLHRSGYVAPNLGDHGLSFESPGGYVMDSTPGLYKNILVLDFKSLYPSIMRTFCIDPLGLINGLNNSEEAIPGFNNAFFSRTHHHLPKLIQHLTDTRQKAKDTHQPMLSQAIKIIMNSLYGVLGSKGCKFYDPRLSSSITLRGHEIMQTTRKWIEEMGYEVIYGDTDSTFIKVDDELDAEQCNEIGNVLAKTINSQWQENIKQRFNLISYLELEFETHYSPFFMPTIRGKKTGSKKRYVGQVIKNDKAQLIFKGMETVRSDWTVFAQEFQKELFTTLFKLDFKPTDIFPILKHYTSALYKGEFDKKLIYKKRLGQHLHDYIKNIPPHVQAIKKYQAINPHFDVQRGQVIEYVYTLDGAEIATGDNTLHYPIYIEKQLTPIAQMIFETLELQDVDIQGTQLSFL
ncbi:DNA polymerase II [Pseudoalteromonas sp. MMG010]|uniref:DNA polymerase II n=1 Tax=Pseudoalteromonas sp. MMG010 TaxID=2822685 RepID=UPI001B3A7719|nr:DNA polymerase II [Pseudoalteromonas sp. MMG010]MBQ4831666.1 DNA polymerase II [Pseudoalteromonas sp. MMG010]